MCFTRLINFGPFRFLSILGCFFFLSAVKAAPTCRQIMSNDFKMSQKETASPTEYHTLQYRYEFWKILAESQNLDILFPNVKTGYLQEREFSWKNTGSPIKTGELALASKFKGNLHFQKIRALMVVLQTILNNEVAWAAREEVRVHSDGSFVWYPTTRTEFDPRRAHFRSGGSLRAHLTNVEPVWEKHAVFISEVLESFPWELLAQKLKSMGIPESLLQETRSRFEFFKEQVIKNTESFLGTPDQEIRKIETLRSLRQTPSHKAQVRMAKSLLRERFTRDFVASTSFKSFDAYKEAVLSIPEYRQFIEEFWNDVNVVLFRGSKSRIPILRKGPQGLFETGTSSVNDHQSYIELRENFEAVSLGLSLEKYRAQIPNSLRSKSAFLRSKEFNIKSSSRYGSDAYVLSGRDLMDLIAKKEIMLTFTLGDSLNMPFVWHGRPILAEDFPFVAAPFILHAREITKEPKAFLALRYRVAHSILKALSPEFARGLESRLGIHVMDKPDPNTENETGTTYAYVEAQIWGPIFVSDAKAMVTKDSEAPGERLREIYKTLGLQLSTYEDKKD